MKDMLLQLQKDLATGFVGRDEIIKSLLLGLVAGENSLLIGPPGTGKSMLARRISESLSHDDSQDYFEYLLTKFSTPEEIFGPLSISELKQDRFCRNTVGYLPSVKIGFLDEIFKASSSILNALLTILNERKFHNGTQSVDVPLQSLISASNELPIGQEELSALYDRFLIRRFVDYVDNEQLSALFNLQKSVAIADDERLSVNELKRIRELAKSVEFPEDVQQAILNIKQKFAETFKEDRDEQWSDRRFVKVVNLMRISAVTNERKVVDFSDVLLLKDCLWNNPDNQEKILEIIKNELKKYDRIVDVNDKQAIQVVNTAKKSSVAEKKPSQNVIKGYQGSGTENDPILIENLNHLLGLQRAEVGQQGYYFKQINDIDCTSINANSWAEITFKGHYDGNHKKIIYNNEQKPVFTHIQDSTIKHLFVENMSLAHTMDNSEVFDCHSTGILLGYYINNPNYMYGKNIEYNVVNDSKIIFCSAGRHLAQRIVNCEIKYCQSSSILIMWYAKDSTIEDCQVNLQQSAWDISNSYVGGVVAEIQNSNIHRCYVDGTFIPEFNFINCSGITDEIDNNSSIQNCAVGEINYDDVEFDVELRNRILRDLDDGGLKNNISIDTNNWGDGQKTADGQDGQSVSASAFNQYYFEHNLGWDFGTVWQWNASENRPELRPRTEQNPQKELDTTQLNSNQSTLLREQMKQNIWL